VAGKAVIVGGALSAARNRCSKKQHRSAHDQRAAACAG
jgi:hypothetical protein